MAKQVSYTIEDSVIVSNWCVEVVRCTKSFDISKHYYLVRVGPRNGVKANYSYEKTQFPLGNLQEARQLADRKIVMLGGEPCLLK